MILTKKETNTPIRVSNMRFNANPEMLESAPCVIVTLKKATQVILVRALLRHEIGKNDQWGDTEEVVLPGLFKKV